jgi:hypothetical protein
MDKQWQRLGFLVETVRAVSVGGGFRAFASLRVTAKTDKGGHHTKGKKSYVSFVAKIYRLYEANRNVFMQCKDTGFPVSGGSLQ